MNLMVTAQGGKTMTSREIAELTGKRHDNVMRVCRELKALGVTPQIEECLFSHSGNLYPEFKLDKRDSLILTARLSPEFTGRVVDRWIELEAAAPKALDLSDPHALRAVLLTYSERVIQLDAKIAADAPKVEFAEAVRALDGVCSVEQIAKTLGYGRNKFFKALKADGILMENRLPYQKYIDRCYFTVVENAPYTDKEGNTHPTFTTRVTGAGQVFLQRKYGRRKDDIV